MSHLARITICGSVLATALAVGQPADDAVEDTGFVITTESNLVIVPLHVYQKKKSVVGLGAESFELFEDGKPQKIAFVDGPAGPEQAEASRTVPTEIILLIDNSLSVTVRGLLDFTTVRSAMLEGLRSDVMISVYGFAQNLRRYTGPTRDLATLQRALDRVFEQEDLGSRIYEAIMQTARDAASRGSNVSRMMIVFSDGQTTTQLSPELVVQSANAFGIPIYPVVLGHDLVVQRGQGLGGGFGLGRQPTPGNNQRGEPAILGPRQQPQGDLNRRSNARAQEELQAIFANFGQRTGGRSYDLDVINNIVMRQILGSLATLAETEYVVGYYPSSVDEELTGHSVEVRLADKKIGTLYGGRRVVVH